MTLALITNDDGIASPGLCALARAALDVGLDVIVAAPSEEASGSSAAIAGTNTIAVTAREGAAPPRSGIRLERRELPDLPGVPAYSVRAAPGLITLLAAHRAFGEVPSVVLSGINHGANVGRAIIHSGTVGAAVTGGVNGARGMAVSLDVGMHPEHRYWETAAAVTRTVLPMLLEQPRGTVINLNVPNIPPDEPLELREAPLARFGIVHTTMTEPHGSDVRLTVRRASEPGDEGSDAALLSAGYATVTSVVAVRESDVRVLTNRI